MFSVNKEKCIQCGACSEVCIFETMKQTSEGVKQQHNVCFSCGQCIAVCPTGALTNDHMPFSEQQARNKKLDISPEEASEFLRSRRSIRAYKEKSVSHDLISNLLNVARMALSAGNSQGISYLVIENKEILNKVKEAVIQYHEKAMQTDSSQLGARIIVDRYRKEHKDTILWNAPCLILALSEKGRTKISRENAIFCLTYLHLYAPTLGLGGCWAGAVENTVFDNWEPMQNALDLGNRFNNISGAFMIGYPKYKYQRLVSRNPLKVEWWE